MKVILKESVRNLGNVGEIHNVSAGYARNFLLPRNLATVANEANTKMLNNQKRSLAKKIAEQKSEAEGLKKKIESISAFTFEKRVGGNGKLFGALTFNEIATELSKKGIDVDRRILTSDRPLKAIGDFTIIAKLFTEVEAKFPIKIVMDEKQKEEMKAAQAKAKKAKAAKATEEKKAEEEVSQDQEQTENQSES